MFEWAQKEIELAIESEKKASEGTNEWEYGVACYKSAMKAYKALLADNLKEMNIYMNQVALQTFSYFDAFTSCCNSIQAYSTYCTYFY